MEQDTSNENRNDFYWKNKLEDVSNLRDAILVDKIATWEKLDNRLRQKQGRINTVWFSIAAACLLFAIIIPLTTHNRNQDVTVKNNAKKVSFKEILPVIVSPKEIAVVHTSPPKNKEKTRRPSVMGHEKTFSVKNIAIKEEPVHPALHNPADIIEELVNSPTADSNRFNTLALTAVKKKLKVVHINELSDAFAETPNIALQSDHHFFQLKLINQQAYTGSSLPSGNTGFTIFKTTRASSN